VKDHRKSRMAKASRLTRRREKKKLFYHQKESKMSSQRRTKENACRGKLKRKIWTLKVQESMATGGKGERPGYELVEAG